MKHDVEADISKALKLAELENRCGMRAVYYVHSFYLDALKDRRSLQKIASLGHEIGYHYDVMDNNEGDYTRATAEFALTLELFNEFGLTIESTCPHGNPMKERDGWFSNKDFFRNPDTKRNFPELLDVVIGLEDLVGPDYLYISDSGYKLCIVGDIKNNDRPDFQSGSDEKIGELDQALKLAQETDNITFISVHSHRLEESLYRAYARVLLFKTAKKVARIAYKSTIGRAFMNRYYYLSKRI